MSLQLYDQALFHILVEAVGLAEILSKAPKIVALGDADTARSCRCNGHLDAQEKVSLLAVPLIIKRPAQKAGWLHLIESFLAVPLTNSFLLLVQFLLLFLFLVLSHSLHHFGIASRHLLWHIILQNELKMLLPLAVQNFNVISTSLIGLAPLLIMIALPNNCLRFDPIQVHLGIHLIDLWLECALFFFFFITSLFLNTCQ